MAAPARRRVCWSAGLVAGAAFVGGCLPAPEHHCSAAEECAGGACVTGYCAFPVDEGLCPSGLRFGDGAGPLAGSCTAPTAPVIDAGVDGPPPSPPPFGRGVDGPLTLGGDAEQSINTCAPLRGAAAGAMDVGFDRFRVQPATAPGLGGFARDRLVMIWQTTGLPAAAAMIGSPAPIVLTGTTDVGRYQIVRAVEVQPDRLTLAEPLAFAVTDGAQVCRVPELTKLSVTSSDGNQVGGLRPAAWNGLSGGVVAFYAAEQVSLAGNGALISASGRGLRGGAGTNASGTMINCDQLTGPPTADGGAHRGEGLVPAWYAAAVGAMETFGLGNGTLGGGGGGCRDAGGGGGGGAGAGGRGGRQSAPNATGNGLGGAPSVFDPRTHLAMGGGGGGGEGNNGQPGSGAAGGGVVLMRAARLTCGNGTSVRAEGAAGGSSPGTQVGQVGDDGAGGGGGGGTIYVEATAVEGCTFRAVGGVGGDTRRDPNSFFLLRGPGGGGGGGRLLVRAVSITGTNQSAAAGSPGQVERPSNESAGAQAGTPGVRCGDGQVGPGEPCDDDNATPADGCDLCVLE